MKTVLAEAENESRTLRCLENDLFLRCSKSFRGALAPQSPVLDLTVRSPTTVRQAAISTLRDSGSK